ncbi:MAG: hypothetical protein Q4F49_05465 [Pseudoxanthomonas suwonensis]|nr:hypothetical protein [Pseudoxanthomonas suwonensis]
MHPLIRLLPPLSLAMLLIACSPATDDGPGTDGTPSAAATPVAADADAPGSAIPTIEEAEATAPAVSDDRIPAPFHGAFDESAASCASASEARLVISAEELRFHESVGRVERVEIPADNEITVRLAMEGEGEQWQASERYALSADGSELYDRGQEPAFVRVRCR